MSASLGTLDAGGWKALHISVRDDPDVVVVGGGIAGVAAALASVRGGARTTLIEKEIALGGLATLGNVIVYLPLCDGNGRQVIAGIAEELLVEAVKGNGASPPALRSDQASVPSCWAGPAPVEERRKRRYQVDFNPAAYILSLEELLLAAGVTLAYDTRFVGVASDAGRITHVAAADKGGLFALAARSVVDATGDADVCIAAGEETVSRAGNVRSGWFYYTSGGALHLDHFTEPFSKNPSVVPAGSMGFACGDGADVTAQVVEYRKLLRARLADLRAGDPRREVHPVLLPTVPCFRMTRRLVGRAEPSAAESLAPAPDGIGMTGDWRRAGPVYHLRYGSLAGRTANLLVAGRCLSIGDDLWDVTRVIPPCALTGQAAGTAAALASAAGIDAAAVPAAELREALRRQGVLLEG